MHRAPGNTFFVEVAKMGAGRVGVGGFLCGCRILIGEKEDSGRLSLGQQHRQWKVEMTCLVDIGGDSNGSAD